MSDQQKRTDERTQTDALTELPIQESTREQEAEQVRGGQVSDFHFVQRNNSSSPTLL